jgi:hypothetical protein
MSVYKQIIKTSTNTIVAEESVTFDEKTLLQVSSWYSFILR